MKLWLYLSASTFLARGNFLGIIWSRLQVKLVKLDMSQEMTGSTVSIAKNWWGGRGNRSRTGGNINLLPIKKHIVFYYSLTANESHCYKNHSAPYKLYCIRHTSLASGQKIPPHQPFITHTVPPLRHLMIFFCLTVSSTLMKILALR